MTTPFPLGMYSSNPNGNDHAAMATFEAEVDKFTVAMGAAPLFMNSFTDFGHDPSTWGSNAGWSSWSWLQSKKAGILIPVVGVPLSDNAHWSPNNVSFFQAVIVGTYDAAYTAIGDAWLSHFPLVYFRLGYEANANFMPWSWSDNAATAALWVQAFQRVVGLLRACAKKASKSVKIVWNPCCINWTALDVRSVYPGDDAVDVHGIDVYSPTYPNGLYDWAGEGRTFANGTEWAADPVNRAHYWHYQNANQWNPHGQTVGWSLQDALDFAKLRSKPVMLCETGSGGDDGNLGPIDEGAFPPVIAGVLAVSGVTVVAVLIWCTDQSDGRWGFLNGDRPNKAAAWRKAFGAVVTDASPKSQVEITDLNRRRFGRH